MPLTLWRMDWPNAADAGARVEAVTLGPDGAEGGGDLVAGDLAIADMMPGAGEPIPIFEIRAPGIAPVPLSLTARWRVMCAALQC